MSKHVQITCLLALLAPFSGIATAQEPTSDPEAPRDDGLVEAVVYSTIRKPNQDLYLYAARGQTPRRLTNGPALDYNAVFSPDGRWLVFSSERSGSGDLYALDIGADTRPVQLTHHRAFDDAAAFSPDGERLAFVSTRGGNADIFVMPFDPADPAAAEAAVTNLTRRIGGDFNPAFSPDGNHIAYSRQDTPSGSLPALPPPGDAASANPGASANPALDTTNTHSDVYVMNADGTNPVRLSEPGGMSGSPAWSPDGEFIYYHRMHDPAYFEGGSAIGEGLEIRRVAPDGTADTFFAAFGLSPAVMADGRVAFFGMRPADLSDLSLGLGDIVSVAADGSDRRFEGDGETPCEAPAFDSTSNLMVCHGPGPVDTFPALETERGELVRAPPGARREVELPDRMLLVHGILGQFPAILPDGDIVWSLVGGSRTGIRPTPLMRSRIDGSAERAIFSIEGETIWAPAVARDAGRIVVSVGPPMSQGTGQVDIWRIDIDGRNAVNLTSETPGNDALATVSSDGRRIVFRSAPGPMARSIQIMDEDGRDRRPVDIGPYPGTMPAVSPDGEWLVVPRLDPGGIKLWIQKVDGSEGRLLEPDRAGVRDASLHPRFSPDGRWVVFTSDRGHMSDEWPLTHVPQPYGDLWAVSVAGSPAIRLTDDKWEDGPSDWGFVRPVQ
jgi:Tol biopolymer transport system component